MVDYAKICKDIFYSGKICRICGHFIKIIYYRDLSANTYICLHCGKVIRPKCKCEKCETAYEQTKDIDVKKLKQYMLVEQI